MGSLQQYELHIGKRQAVRHAAWKLRNTRLSFTTDVEPLRNEFLRLQSLCEEVVGSVQILLETDDQIVKSHIKAVELGTAGDLWGMCKEHGSASAGEAWTRMSLSWKMFLYSVRCFQDCIYKAILHAKRERVGPGASMSRCLSAGVWRQGSGVGALIHEHLPGYPSWFIQTRDLRNKLKSGLSVQSVWSGREPEHFIVLRVQRWNGCYIENIEEHPLKFDLAVESLEMCLAVARLVSLANDEWQSGKRARLQRMDRINEGDLLIDADSEDLD